MSAALTLASLLWLQEVPPQALLLGMAVAYLLCFAGLLLAYLSYRRRRRSRDHTEERKGR